MKNIDEKTLNEIVEKVVSSIKSRGGSKTVAVGSDHGGFHQKQFFLNFLEESGFSVLDLV